MSNIDLRKRAAREARRGGPPAPKKPQGTDYSAWEKEAYELLKPRLRKLDVRLGNKVAHGSNIDVYLCRELEKIYSRKNLCLKVFWHSKSIWGFDGASALCTILESTIAQNLLAMKGISPRVYDLVCVGGKTAQVTDYLQGARQKRIVGDSRFEFWDSAWENDLSWVDGKMVDFQGTKLKDYDEYKRQILAETIKRNEANGYLKGIYQSTDYHPGLRDTKERLRQYQFKDFKDKTVLDIGCSNGMFLRAADDLGAKRVVGIDFPNMVEMAEELAILDGYFNIDFYGVDLKTLKQKELEKLTGIKRFNIHLFFAMENHVGWADWVKNCDTLYYEGHGAVKPFRVEDHRQKKN